MPAELRTQPMLRHRSCPGGGRARGSRRAVLGLGRQEVPEVLRELLQDPVRDGGDGALAELGDLAADHQIRGEPQLRTRGIRDDLKEDLVALLEASERGLERPA